MVSAFLRNMRRHGAEVMHTCHARNCTKPCKPEFLMCRAHWRLVPRDLQRAVWDNYRDGQCDDMRPSREWHDAADAAIQAVYDKERGARRGRQLTLL